MKIETASGQSKLEHIISCGVKLTPMMKQYHEIKQNYPQTLLFFRMGDFYELFFEDAENAAKMLNITLTHRGKLGEFPIPMAGIPFHAASNYVDRITNLGLKVAICEQVEDPKMAKGIVKRAVTQVASPSMPYDIEKINGSHYHFLASVTIKKEKFYLTLIDYTTGHFIGHILDSFEECFEKIQLYGPKEFISFFDQWEQYPWFSKYLDQMDIAHTYLSREYFSTKFTQHYIEKLIPHFQSDKTLATACDFYSTIGAMSYYIHSTQPAHSHQHIKPFQLILNKREMKVTYATLTGLEILPKSKDRYRQSLIGFMDKTLSSLGARKLKQFFLNPTRDIHLLNHRLDYIETLINDQSIITSQRELLKDVRDCERIMAKVMTMKATPGDLINLGKTLHIALKLASHSHAPQELLPQITPASREKITSLIKEIKASINDEIGASLDKGNLIKKGFHKQRDQLAFLSQNSNQSLLDLESQYREQTHISNLKIKSNNVAGYFIEVSKSHLDKVPETFTRKQTLTNSERYTSPELKQLEQEIFLAKDKLLKLERKILHELIEKIKLTAKEINLAAELIALNDVFQSLAWIAIQEGFTKPIIKKEKKILEVTEGFHPLIKKELGQHFTPHSLKLSSECSFGLITGPNMAGKTTVMREMAIIQFLTQIGSFIPAQRATVGLCDYLFSRLGASDDIIKGQSTFMVEMSETAEILRHATDQSFIILDEIGRGTSTYDGLSIAWALVEHLTSELQCLSLFSTHYHELIELVSTLNNAKNLTVKTHKEGKKVIFLYELIEQGATQSFGINVAALAGLPPSILKRAEGILNQLETKKNSYSTTKKESTHISMFEPLPPPHPLLEELSLLDTNQLTPLQALNLLSEWKTKF